MEQTATKSERAEMREHALLDESMSVLTDSVSSSVDSITDQPGSDLADDEEVEHEDGGDLPMPGTEAFDVIVNALLELSPDESRDSSDAQEAACEEEGGDEEDEFHMTKIRKAISDAAWRFGPVVVLADLKANQQSSQRGVSSLKPFCRRERKKQLWWRYHLLHSLPDGANINEYFASLDVQEQMSYAVKSQSLLAGEFPGCVDVSGDLQDLSDESSPDTSREEAEEEDTTKCSDQVDSSSSSPGDLSNLDHGDVLSGKGTLDPLCFTEVAAAYTGNQAESATAADHDGDTTSYASAKMFEEDSLVVSSQAATPPDRQFKITSHNGGTFVYETGLEVHSSPTLSHAECMNASETPMLALELRSKFTEEEDADVFSEADQSLAVAAANNQEDEDGGIHFVPLDEPVAQDPHPEHCRLQLVTETPTSIGDDLALNQDTPESLNHSTDGGFHQLLFDKDNASICSSVFIEDEKSICAVALQDDNAPIDLLDESVEVDEVDFHQRNADANESNVDNKQDAAVAEIATLSDDIAAGLALPCTAERIKNVQETVPEFGPVVTVLEHEPLLGDVGAQTLQESVVDSSADDQESAVAPAPSEPADEQVHPIAKGEPDSVAASGLVDIDAHQDLVLELPPGGADQTDSVDEQVQGTDIAPCLQAYKDSQDVSGIVDSTGKQIHSVIKNEHQLGVVETVNSFRSTGEPFHAIDIADCDQKMAAEHKVVVETVNSIDSMDEQFHQQKVVVETVHPVGQVDEVAAPEHQSGLKEEGENAAPDKDAAPGSENDAIMGAPVTATRDADQTLSVSIEDEDAKSEEPAGSMLSVVIDPTNGEWLGSFSNNMPQVEAAARKEHKLVQETGDFVPVADIGNIMGLSLKNDGDFAETESLDVGIKIHSKTTKGAWLGTFRNRRPQVDIEEELCAERRRTDAEIDDDSYNPNNGKTTHGTTEYAASAERIDLFAKLEDEFVREIVGPRMENSSFRPLAADPAKECTKQPNASESEPTGVSVQEEVANEIVVATEYSAPILVCKDVALADLLLLEDNGGPSEVNKQTNETSIPTPDHSDSVPQVDNTHPLVESPSSDQNKQETAAEIGTPGSAFENKSISEHIPEIGRDASGPEILLMESVDEPPPLEELSTKEGVCAVNLACRTTEKEADGKLDPQLFVPEDQVGPAYREGKSIQTVSETILIDFNEKLASSSQRLLQNLCCDTASEPITDDDDDIKLPSAPSEPSQKPVNEDETTLRPSTEDEPTPCEENARDTRRSAPDGADGQTQNNAGVSPSDELTATDVPNDAHEPDKADTAEGAKLDGRPMEMVADNAACVLDIDATPGSSSGRSTGSKADTGDEPSVETKDHAENTIDAAMEADNGKVENVSVTLKPILEGAEKSKEITDQVNKAASWSSDEKRFILKSATGDDHHTPIAQATVGGFHTVQLCPVLPKDGPTTETALPSAPKRADQPGDTVVTRITKQFTQQLFQSPPPSSHDIVVLPSLASTDSEVTSSSDEEENGSDLRVSMKKGVMVDYKKNKYRGFVVVLHERHGVMLMHSSGIKRDEVSQHWQLPGGQVHECEFIEAARYTNDKRSQINLASKACAARELFDQTGLDFRFKLGRLVPASLRPEALKQSKKPGNELKHRYFFVLRIKDNEFLSQGNCPTGPLGNDLMLALSTQHSEFTFQPEPADAANMVRLQSAGKCAEALHIVLRPSQQEMLGKAVVPLQPDPNDIGMVAEISDFLAKTCGFCF